MSLLPSSPDVAPEGEPRVVVLDSEEADDLMAALSSTTARELLAALHEEPAPPGELADRVDTSLQNAQYHLEKLEDAGAIEVVGTAYSEKGREMRVYGPADSPLVIFAGEKERASGLRAALSRLFGGFAALVVGSLVVQQVFGESLLAGTGDVGSPNGGDGGPAGETGAPAGETATPVAGTSTPAAETSTPAAAQTPAATRTPATEPSGGDGGAGAGGAEDADDGSFTASQDATETSSEAATPASGDSSAGTDVPHETPTPEPDVGTLTDGSVVTPTRGSEDAAAGEPTATESAAEAARTVSESGAGATPTAGGDGIDLFGVLDAAFGSGLPPGLAFFLGGALVLTVVVATTYLRARP